jgi:cytochrome c-type biogenesis protein CcmH
VLGENDKAAEAFAKADAIAPLEPRQLADWAEAHVRQLKPGQPPDPAAVAVLERLEKAEPRNALALFYLGAADFARGDKQAAAPAGAQRRRRESPHGAEGARKTTHRPARRSNEGF